MTEPTITAILKDAVLLDGIAHGDIYGDIHHRWPDGTCIFTSRIQSGPDADGIIVTRNSTYRIENLLK